MSKLGTALAFLAGAALGGVSAWYVAKTRYDELSEQEIDSAKQAFYAREQQLKEEIAALKEQLAKEDDENGVIIDEPEDIVGDALNHFGEYEEDSVFVRSDPKRCDYEILRDLRSYAEFRSTLPPKI